MDNGDSKEVKPEHMQERGAAIMFYSGNMEGSGWARNHDRTDVEEIRGKLHTNLIALNIDVSSPQMHPAKKQAFLVLINKIQNTAFQMKNTKAPGNSSSI